MPDGCEHPAHLFYLIAPDPAARARLLAHLRARRIGATFHYGPLHRSPAAQRWGAPASLPVTERVADTLVRLPLYADLTEGEQSRVISAVTEFWS